MALQVKEKFRDFLYTLDSINVNKTATATFGSSKMVKQIVMKSMRELCDLPTPVARILDRYRTNGGL